MSLQQRLALEGLVSVFLVGEEGVPERVEEGAEHCGNDCCDLLVQPEELVQEVGEAPGQGLVVESYLSSLWLLCWPY